MKEKGYEIKTSIIGAQTCRDLKTGHLLGRSLQNKRA
jgi:hypothetical protein